MPDDLADDHVGAGYVRPRARGDGHRLVGNPAVHRDALEQYKMKHGFPQEIVAAFPGKRVLVIGDVMLDEYIWGEVRRISPEAPVPVVEARRSTYAPGGAGNTAANVVSLGGQAMLGGVVGRDYQA